MREKILNEDVVNFAVELQTKGYTQKKIAELVKEKFHFKKCSIITVRRALKKKITKSDQK